MLWIIKRYRVNKIIIYLCLQQKIMIEFIINKLSKLEQIFSSVPIDSNFRLSSYKKEPWKSLKKATAPTYRQSELDL